MACEICGKSGACGCVENPFFAASRNYGTISRASSARGSDDGSQICPALSASQFSVNLERNNEEVCLECFETIEQGVEIKQCSGTIGCASRSLGCGRKYHAECVGNQSVLNTWRCKNPACDSSEAHERDAIDSIIADAIDAWTTQRGGWRHIAFLMQRRRTFSTKAGRAAALQAAATGTRGNRWWGSWVTNDDFRRLTLTHICSIIRKTVQGMYADGPSSIRQISGDAQFNEIKGHLQTLLSNPADPTALRRAMGWCDLLENNDKLTSLASLDDSASSDNPPSLLTQVNDELSNILDGVEFSQTALGEQLSELGLSTSHHDQVGTVGDAQQRTLCSRFVRAGVPLLLLGTAAGVLFGVNVQHDDVASATTPAPDLPPPFKPVAPASFAGPVGKTLFNLMCESELGTVGSIAILVLILLVWLFIFLRLNFPSVLSCRKKRQGEYQAL